MHVCACACNWCGQTRIYQISIFGSRMNFLSGQVMHSVDCVLVASPSILLTHWGRVTHICVSDLTRIGSDNGLSPGRHQAIIRTNAGVLLIRPLGTNFSEILIEILIFSFKKMRLKVSSAKRRPFCLGLNVLTKPPSNHIITLTHPPWTKWLALRRWHFQMHFHEWKVSYFD